MSRTRGDLGGCAENEPTKTKQSRGPTIEVQTARMWSAQAQPQALLSGKVRSDAALQTRRERAVFTLLVCVVLLAAVVAGLSAYVHHAFGVAVALAAAVLAGGAAMALAGGSGAGGGRGRVRARRALLAAAALAGGTVLLLAVVRFAPPNVFVQRFPRACPPAAAHNCVRVAVAGAHRANGSLPLRFASPPVSCDAVLNATRRFWCVAK